MAEIVELRDSTFAEEVYHSDRATLVEFWAPWCKPCMFLNPVLEEVAGELGGTVKILKLNVDENPMAATLYGVRSVPTMILFRQEDELDKITGFVSKNELLRRIRLALRHADGPPDGPADDSQHPDHP
ncbi:MAG: thioredoxin [Clostridia bacterium]|nr:thioredoxin [Clostridia bacterium]